MVEPTKSLSYVCPQITAAMQGARQTDTNTIKKELHRLYNFVSTISGVAKSALGFNHDGTGPLLCPPNLDWGDDKYVYSLRPFE